MRIHQHLMQCNIFVRFYFLFDILRSFRKVLGTHNKEGDNLWFITLSPGSCTTLPRSKAATHELSGSFLRLAI